MTPITDPKAWLLARYDDLVRRMDGIDAALHAPVSSDWEDMATDREADEVLEGLGNDAQHDLRMIGAALARIDAGSYGVCTKCGDEIAPERLQVVPWTPFCRGCAA